MRLAAALVLAAGLAGASGNWEAPPEAKARKSTIASSPEALRRGKFLYRKNCARCHGDKGKGDGPNAKFGPADPEDLTDPLMGGTDGLPLFEGMVEAIAA